PRPFAYLSVRPPPLTPSIPSTTLFRSTLTISDACTTATLVSSLNPSIYGDLITFTATVTANSPSTINPASTGSVTFMDGSTTLCSAVAIDAGGQATCPVNDLSASSHSVIASYSGASNYSASPASSAISQVINPAALSVTTDPSSK